MSKNFKELLKSVKSTYHYVSAQISLDFAKDTHNLMAAQKLSKKELAEKMETSPAYITKLLRGDVNYTVDTMAKVAMALDADVTVSLVSKAEGSSFVEGRMYAFQTKDGIRYRELKSVNREWCYADDTGQRHLKDTVRELTSEEWEKLRGEK